MKLEGSYFDHLNLHQTKKQTSSKEWTQNLLELPSLTVCKNMLTRESIEIKK